jgi:general secretion pathway protein D
MSRPHATLLSAATLILGLLPLAAYAQPQQSSDAQSTPTASAAAPVAATAHQRRNAEKAYLKGAHAIETRDTRTAYLAFSEAATLDPGNADYQTAAAVAKAHFVTDLVQQAEKARILNKPEVTRARLAEALELDPQNPMVAQHIGELAYQEAPELPSNDLSSTIAEAIQLAPLPGRRSFHLRSDGQSLLRQVLTTYGITPSFDASVRTQTVRFDADDIDFKQAEQLLRLETDTFFVPLDPHRLLVARDTKENRANYERLLEETVYLPGLSNTEITDIGNIARNVLDVTQASVQPSAGTLTVRAPASRLAALNHTLADMLNGHSQVLLEIKLYEIARSRSINEGVVVPQQFNAFNLQTEIQSVLNGNQALINQIVSSGLANANDLTAIAAILLASGQIQNSVLSQPFVVFGGGISETGLTLGSPQVNLALNSSESRAVDQVQLRVQDLESGTFVAGLRYPITQSSYSNLTGSGINIPGLNSAGISSQLAALGLNTTALNQQTIPQVQYQDLGVSLKATPHIHGDQSVSLKLELKVQALAGSTVNAIPVLTNRQFIANVDLLDGQTTLVSSNLTQQEARAITGIPGLSEIPGLRSTTDRDVQKSDNELIILVTPHVVRRSHPAPASQAVSLPPHQ